MAGAVRARHDRSDGVRGTGRCDAPRSRAGGRRKRSHRGSRRGLPRDGPHASSRGRDRPGDLQGGGRAAICAQGHGRSLPRSIHLGHHRPRSRGAGRDGRLRPPSRARLRSFLMQASPAGITILEGARFLVADGIGNVSGGLEGFYADDTRQLSRWRMTLDGRAPMLLASGTGDYASATIYLRHDSGTPSRPSEVGAIRRLFTSAGALHERLTLENYGSRPCEVVVGYEFDADFLDIFEVKSQSYGERDLAFAKSITPLHTSRWYDDGDG